MSIGNASDNAYPGWYTQRGCALSSDDCTDGLCSLCSGNNCNAEVFPTDRHKCLKCVDSDCNPAKSEYCSVYLEGSQDCVTLYNEGLLSSITFTSKTILNISFIRRFCACQKLLC